MQNTDYMYLFWARARGHVVSYALLQNAAWWAVRALQIGHSRRLQRASDTRGFVDKMAAFVTESFRDCARGRFHRARLLEIEIIKAAVAVVAEDVVVCFVTVPVSWMYLVGRRTPDGLKDF